MKRVHCKKLCWVLKTFLVNKCGAQKNLSLSLFVFIMLCNNIIKRVRFCFNDLLFSFPHVWNQFAAQLLWADNSSKVITYAYPRVPNLFPLPYASSCMCTPCTGGRWLMGVVLRRQNGVGRYPASLHCHHGCMILQKSRLNKDNQ